MPTTKKMIDEVLSLPVEERAIIADSLYGSGGRTKLTI